MKAGLRLFAVGVVAAMGGPLWAQDTIPAPDNGVANEAAAEPAALNNASSPSQDQPATVPMATDPAPISAEPAAQSVAAAAPASGCELHVWPTHNYLGIQMGLLSGFGALGAVADMEAHDGRVKTVKDLMREYLGPEIQMDELNKIGLTKTLKLDGYTIVLEEPTPFNEDLKNNPELKAKVKAMNAKEKAGERLSASTNPCYAELLTTHIFYHKAMMYGSNLFTGFIFREFKNGSMKATRTARGQVKNPLEHFPPKTPEAVDAAKAELRDAFAKDYVEWVEKKAFGPGKR